MTNKQVLSSISQSKYIVIGSGLFGLTIAERIANVMNEKVTILENRDHIGGNSHSYIEPETGIEIHKYGSHIFHTSNEQVWNYVNRFTKFTNYKHKVVANSLGQVYLLPINLLTISQIFGVDLNPTSAKRKIEEDIVAYRAHDTSENLNETNDERISASFESEAISKVGPTLYSRFFRGYTAKQWQTDPKKLPKEIFTRLPLRFDYNSEYFDDSFQGLPVEGYASWINRMVESPNIEVFTNTNYFDFREDIGPDKVLIYTGPIDQFFDYRFGRLGWRTVDFDLEVIDERDFQGGAVKNYTDEDVPFTRIHEFKHLHPERKSQMESGKTVIAKEFSRFAEDTDEPFYPINTNANREKFLQYRELANNLENTYFGGRLATYKYLDMHMAIASALTMFDNEINRENVIEN